ncbi:MAG: D-inositol-3-phosphate glycosyltransferase [Rhodocyclaceae bacterium]|nr:glycosyltransferase family 4 protein [Zoogloeaceae bacterium]MBV6409084.1 D-inositol-3-phosphate glycosyltransferase [Rhodocyclaceae bacterium]
MNARIALDMHTVGLRQTGNETYIRNLAEQLSVASLPWRLFFYHTLSADVIEASRWKGTVRRLWPHQPLFRIPLSFPLALSRDRIDLAHFQYVAPPACPCPTVVTIHDISYEFFPEYFHPLQRMRMRALIPLSARRAAHVVTISEFSKRTIVERYGVAEENITVTPLGVSAVFRPIAPGQAEEMTRRFAIARPFILGVGNLQPRKNLERLIRAFARMTNGGDRDFDLVLVGQMAWQGHRVEAEVHRLGLDDRVRLTGYVSEEELVALYNRATVFAYPSIFEGFGLPVIEAMACGTPVLTSCASSLPEVAGSAALQVDPHDDEAISSELARLADDAALRAALSIKGREQAARFTWRATAELTARVFERVLERGS